MKKERRKMLLNQLIYFVTEHGWNSLFYNIFFAAGVPARKIRDRFEREQQYK